MEKIDSIDKFINFSFIELFRILNKEKTLEKYEELDDFEKKLEIKIREIIKKYRDENNKNNLIKKKTDENVISFINLLKEKFTSDNYKETDYPFYDYFYYSDYLNEDYINEKLSHMEENKYPVLKNYLHKILNKKEDTNKYSLDKLNIYNTALNLINEKYFNNISRDYANKIKLKDDQIYINNKDIFEKFIKFYNDLHITYNNEIIKLSSDKYLSSFFIDNNDTIGNTYISIYNNFIKNQNDLLDNLLDIKIDKGIFDTNCKNKINIQNITEEEIFTQKLGANESFIEILFNSSYKKILDSESRSYELYKEYEINYDLIEENMTDQLLKNKKMLNENNITEFIYNNELFSNKITNAITFFKNNYTIKNTILDDKVNIYKFYEPNKKNINSLGKKVIDDFITLINFLNDKRRENNKDNSITEESKLYEIVAKDELKDTISGLIGKIFEDKDGLTVNKIPGIFDYYLKLIYEDIIKELKKYQETLDNETIEKINTYYKKDHTIKKKDLAYAIRIFITLVLIPEEDKENKIKKNKNNIVKYLRSPDLWNQDIHSIDFNKNLNEIKELNIQINQITSFYEVLGRDIEDTIYDDVKDEINKINIDDKPPAKTPEILSKINVSKKEEIKEEKKDELKDKKEEIKKVEDEDDDDTFKKSKSSDNDSESE